MATSEPAPLATAPDTATAERLAAAAATPDETWEEDAPKETATDVKPWGRGKLHLPTIHRVRLDGGAEATLVREADLLLNLAGVNRITPDRRGGRPAVYVDIDPA